MFKILWLGGLALALIGCGGGGGGNGSGSAAPMPPSGLTYASPATVVVGKTTTLSATVTGTVSNFAVSPSLPAGLSLNASNGAISGAPTAASAKATYTITASNGSGSTTFGLVLTVNPAAPTKLSYVAPPPLLVGKPATALNPTVTGTVSSYTVSPELPAGLALDPVAGIITGTPTTVTAQATYSISASNVTGSTVFALSLKVDRGPTVQLTATATDPSGSLNYLWQTTDGTLSNANGITTNWLLPAGPGIHFAYVTAFNGQGGYSVGRIAVNTDAPFGTASVTPPAMTYGTPLPKQPAQTGVPVRWFVTNGPFPAPAATPIAVAASGIGFIVYDYTADPNGISIASSMTDYKGSVAFQNLPIGHTLVPFCFFPPAYDIRCSVGSVTPNAGFASALFYQDIGVPGIPSGAPIQAGVPSLVGSLIGADLSRLKLGINDAFFGKNVPAIVTLTTPSCPAGSLCASAAAVNDYGDFTVPLPTAMPGDLLTATLSIEKLTPQSLFAAPHALTAAEIADGLSLGTVQVGGASVPAITGMTATYNGSSVGRFWPSLHDYSDQYPRDTFLSYKGSDSRLSACMYYRAIGAVPGVPGASPDSCGQFGFYSSAINFADWKRTVQIDQPGDSTVTATYVNVVDLNLTREHHSISHGPNNVAAYVCNHTGPVDGNGNPLSVTLPASQTTPAEQQAVDTAVANAVNKNNLVACVAMDYMPSNANGGVPLTRFLVFGPSGELLPSVNLDGKGEKFLPGACIACHGGDNYAGKFPEDGSGYADVGSHFLPYDEGNFAFSPRGPNGAPTADQELAIFKLNTNILDTSPSLAAICLIKGCVDSNQAQQAGWYNNYTSTTQNQLYVPTVWANDSSTYTEVVARSCRTCHAALPAVFNWDAVNLITFAALSSRVVCGGATNKYSNHAMPNSANAFDRFWNSMGSTTSADQVALLSQFYLTHSATLPGGCTSGP